jgi:hypothetical protein
VRWAATLLIVLGVLSGASVAVAQEPADRIVVLFEASVGAGQMHSVLQSGAPDVLRALRSELGDRSRVVRRDSLGRALTACDAAERECGRRIVRALGGARVLHLRVDRTRGAGEPIVRDGRRVGHRMLSASVVAAGWLGEVPPRREQLAAGASSSRLIHVLVRLTREEIARPAPSE